MPIAESRRPLRLCALGLVLLFWTLACPQIEAASPEIRIAPGAGSFPFVVDKGVASKEMTVYTYLPERARTNEAPIVFVLHGRSKTAKGFRDNWALHAERYGFMVVAPLFDAKQWGGGEYSYASVIGSDGKIRDASMWSYGVIEHLFDAIRLATGNRTPHYFLYGFSEGGQFVHRLVLLLPEARYARAIAGNPGWYTRPQFDIRFPYGLFGTPVTKESLKRSLGRDFVLMLGDKDTDPNDPGLRKTRQALLQGLHRFARGKAFFKEAKERAAELKTAFGWRLNVVPEVAHEAVKMSGPAAVLFGP